MKQMGQHSPMPAQPALTCDGPLYDISACCPRVRVDSFYLKVLLRATWNLGTEGA